MTEQSHTFHPVHRYLRQWVYVPRLLVLLLTSFPVAIVVWSLTVSVTALSLGTMVVLFLGAVIGAGLLAVLTGFAAVWGRFVAWAFGTTLVLPEGPPAQPGVTGWVRQWGTHLPAWRALAYFGGVHTIVSCLTWVLSLTLVLSAVGLVTAPVWVWLPEVSEETTQWIALVWNWATGVDLGDARGVAAGVYLIFGLLLVSVLPMMLRGLVAVEWGAVRVFLGQNTGDLFRAEAAQLRAAGAAVQEAEQRTLMQIERDLHDGPQHKLVRVRMDLEAAQRRLSDNPEDATRILREADTVTAAALAEIRALGRGFAPPILQDRGLQAALDTLIAQLPGDLDASFDWQLTAEPVLEAVQRTTYFVAAELLGNCAAHAQATSVTVKLFEPDGGDQLVLEVRDNGVGGADLKPQHGLDDIVNRLRSIGGEFTVSSPSGGPTHIQAMIPNREQV